MQEIERYFKIYFDEGGNNNMRYYIEEKSIDSEWEFIPLLTQGYVRCLNNLKKGFGHDMEASELFHNIIRRILLLSYENIDLINRDFNDNLNFNILKFLIGKDTETRADGSFLSKIFDAFSETDNKDEITANVNVKYEIKIGTKGHAVMYHVSFRINSFIQFQSYIIMLSHLLPRLKNFKSFIFFLNYMIEIDKEIEKNDYTSTFGMANIIKNASNNFRKTAIQWINEDDNDDFAKLILCVPEF